jgi:alpha-N-arabinofuranosidase
VINRHIYGHFIEHLGGVIYDGIWVGRNSKIPNVDGIRRSFVEDMKRIAAPNLRWPGGCFADGYHWRDGVGAVSKRPRTYNYWESQMPEGTSATEPNEFGTHEFMRLCRLVGAEPYLAANVGSSTPKEFYDWVSYCNAPAGSLSLADERGANGDKEPFRVQYWGVGNESWGCGGRMTAAEYAARYRQFSAQVPSYTRPFLVAVGPRGHSTDLDLSWTSGFFEAMQGIRGAAPDGYALHYYTDFRPTKVRAEASTTEEWYAVLHLGAKIDEVLNRHWAIMGKYDPQHRTRFVIDEWGTWYSQSRRIAPRYILSQTITLRDAVHAAMTFDIFNRHADKIAMANIAQTVNCLHSLFTTQEDKYIRTPAYHVFAMYSGHMNGRLVPMRIAVDPIEVPLPGSKGKLPGIAGSSSVRDRTLTVTLTNASTDSDIAVRLRVPGALEAKGTVLTHSDPAAANTFTAPEEVKPASLPVTVSGDKATVRLPKQAVASLQIRLG